MKQVLVTGGARGIGMGIARAFLARGHHVTVTGLTDEEVETVGEPGLTAILLDVTDDSSVDHVLAGRALVPVALVLIGEQRTALFNEGYRHIASFVPE